MSHDKHTTLIELACGFDVDLPETLVDPLPELGCSHCGGKLKYIHFVLPQEHMLMAGSGYLRPLFGILKGFGPPKHAIFCEAG